MSELLRIKKQHEKKEGVFATKIFLKDGRLTIKTYQYVKETYVKKNGKHYFYPMKFKKGQGRFFSFENREPNILGLISALKLKPISMGNDAPQGGKNGNFIQVSTMAINKINRLYNTNL